MDFVLCFLCLLAFDLISLNFSHSGIQTVGVRVTGQRYRQDDSTCRLGIVESCLHIPEDVFACDSPVPEIAVTSGCGCDQGLMLASLRLSC